MDCLLDGSLDCTGAIVVISYLSTNAPLVCDLSAIKSAVIFSFFYLCLGTDISAMVQPIGVTVCLGAYNSGKHGNLRESVNSGKLREFKIYSGNLCDSISWASSCVHNCQ